MQFIDGNYTTYSPSKWLTYDDVILMPRYSTLKSRNDPKLSLSTYATAGVKMALPIISANMDTVTEGSMAVAMAKAGGLGIIHKYYGDERKQVWLDDLMKIKEVTEYPAFSIGLAQQDLDTVYLALSKVGKAIVCVDVAHGDMEIVYNQVRKLALAFPGHIQIIAGNVATPTGANLLIKAGAHGIKVGIGGGSLCTTRVQTGHGVPNLSAIMAIRRTIHGQQSNCTLIADGGIRNSGDIVKALAAGADSVMVGNLFAGTDECSGEQSISEHRTIYKYRGQSSAEFNEFIGKNNVTAEGESTWIKAKGPVTNVIKELTGGIRSGMSYAGAYNLKELYNYSTFLEITPHGFAEGLPHGINNEN